MSCSLFPAMQAPVLVHADDTGVDHLHRRTMSGSQHLYDLVPDIGPPPADKAVVAGRTGP